MDKDLIEDKLCQLIQWKNGHGDFYFVLFDNISFYFVLFDNIPFLMGQKTYYKILFIGDFN